LIETSSWRWRVAPFVSAILFWLAFPPVACYPLVFVAMIPLLMYLQRPDRSRSRLCSVFAAGFLFHLAGFFWIHHVTTMGLLLLAAYASLYWVGFAGLAASWRDSAGSPGWPFRMAAAWTVLEHVRGTALSGIPWLLTGHALAGSSLLSQIADLGGVSAPTFLAALVNTALVQAGWCSSEAAARRGNVLPRRVAMILLLFSASYGLWRVRDVDAATSAGPDVLLVQGNVEQSVKKAGLHWGKIHAIYANATRDAIRQSGLPEIVIWPETMHPAIPVTRVAPGERDPLGFARMAPTRAVVGALLYEPGGAGRQWNSALALDSQGAVTGRYDKTHLVPVGEYFPFRAWPFWETLVKTFTALDRVPDLEAGTALRPLEVGEWFLGALICYECAFADIARAQVTSGAQILVNLSNEAWYRDSAELDQMLAMSRFRCIETRTGMARATNSGISAILDPVGRIVGVIEDEHGRQKEVAGTLRGRVPVGPRNSLYLVMGEWLAAAAALSLALDWAYRIWRHRSSRLSGASRTRGA